MFNISALYTLHYFHFDPFLGVKTELFSSLFTLLRFQTNKYLSLGVHIISQKCICFSLSDNEAFKASDFGGFKLFCFWCSHYRVAFLFSSVFI